MINVFMYEYCYGFFCKNKHLLTNFLYDECLCAHSFENQCIDLKKIKISSAIY